MAKFESPLVNKSFGGSGMREFEVPDEGDQPMPRGRMPMEEEHYHEEPKIIQAPMRSNQSKTKLSDSAKKRIEMLLGMTEMTRKVDIDGNVFILQTLPGEEVRDAVKAIMPFDGTIEAPFEARRQFLARSLTHIAGIEIHQFIGSYEFDVKLSFIDNLGNAFLDRLYEEYTILSNESKNKYSIKTAADAKEVVEDLKK